MLSFFYQFEKCFLLFISPDFDSFLSLSQYSTVRNGDSTFSGPIISTVPIRFGDRHSSVNTVYVSINDYKLRIETILNI